jgi:hypothetical protein
LNVSNLQTVGRRTHVVTTRLQSGAKHARQLRLVIDYEMRAGSVNALTSQ